MLNPVYECGIVAVADLGHVGGEPCDGPVDAAKAVPAMLLDIQNRRSACRRYDQL